MKKHPNWFGKLAVLLALCLLPSVAHADIVHERQADGVEVQKGTARDFEIQSKTYKVNGVNHTFSDNNGNFITSQEWNELTRKNVKSVHDFAHANHADMMSNKGHVMFENEAEKAKNKDINGNHDAKKQATDDMNEALEGVRASGKTDEQMGHDAKKIEQQYPVRRMLISKESE